MDPRLVVTLVGMCSLVLPSPGEATPNKLLVLLIDGFRWDYFDHFEEAELPGFRTLMEGGVKADYLQPTFPSYSFVNFYSLMTGRHSSHLCHLLHW